MSGAKAERQRAELLRALQLERERPMARWNVAGATTERVWPRTRLSVPELIEEVEFLLPHDSFDSIAARLGFKPSTLEQRIRRAGRHDLMRRAVAA